MLYLHLHAELVQRAFEEHHRGAQSLDVQILFRPHVYAVGGGGQVVFACTRSFEIGHQRLAGFAELFEIGADFLQLGPTGGDIPRLEHHRFDAGIDGGFAQQLPDIFHGALCLLLEKRDRKFDRRPLRNLTFQN